MEIAYIALFASYFTAVALWWLFFKASAYVPGYPAAWKDDTPFHFEAPWKEVGYVLVGIVGVLLVGQLWVRDWMLPKSNPLFESVNQFLIFLPILLVPLIRRQGVGTMLLPRKGLPVRLGFGLLMAACALLVFAAFRPEANAFPVMAGAILDDENLDAAVQVLCEDVAIGILLVRLSALFTRKWVIVGVAALFALGHVPSMVARGVSMAEMTGLVGDFSLGLMVLGTILKSKDIIWFWPVHLVMDLTQFTRISGI